MSNKVCTAMAYAFNRALGRTKANSPYLDKLLVKQNNKMTDLHGKHCSMLTKLYDTPDYRSYRNLKLAIVKIEYEIDVQRAKIERTMDRINHRKIKSEVGTNG